MRNDTTEEYLKLAINFFPKKEGWETRIEANPERAADTGAFQVYKGWINMARSNSSTIFEPDPAARIDAIIFQFS